MFKEQKPFDWTTPERTVKDEAGEVRKDQTGNSENPGCAI